jgi:hypothetical protein
MNVCAHVCVCVCICAHACAAGKPAFIAANLVEVEYFVNSNDYTTQ